jgi:hypothetical protein
MPDPTGSALLAWLEAIRAHEMGGSTGAYVVAETVYRGIRKAGRLPGGLDKILVARRCRRAILELGVSLEYAASAAVLARNTYLAAVGDPEALARQDRAGGFDVLK